MWNVYRQEIRVMGPQKVFPFLVISGLIIFFFGSFIRGSLAMTMDEEKKLGKKILLEMEKQVEWVRDPTIQVFVDKIGDSIVREVSPNPFEFKFYVIKAQDPNAFAIPGGHIFVSSGLIRFVDTEDELAGVMGHEIGHSVLRHIDKAMDRAKRLSLLTLAAIIAGAFLSAKSSSGGGTTLAGGAMGMAEALMLKYSRGNEEEADTRGMKYMTDAGYDPRAMVTFLKKIYRLERASSPDVPTYLETHPGIDDRITYLSNNFTFAPHPLGAHPPAAGDLKKIQIRLFVGERGGLEGINEFSALLGENAGDVNLLYGLGISYVTEGRAHEAIPYLSEALKTSPKDALIVRELGIAYFQAKEVDKALDVLKDSLHTFPHDTTILYYLAQTKQEKGQWNDALSLYQQVLELDPRRVELYYNLGVIYDKKGVLDLSHENFGRYFKERGQLEIALFHFRKALEYTHDPLKKRELEGLIKECEVQKKRHRYQERYQEQE